MENACKVTRIIEYQPDKQRTPSETLEFLKDEIDKGDVTHMMVIYRKGRHLCDAPAAKSRNYTRAEVLWDVEQWKRWYLSGKD